MEMAARRGNFFISSRGAFLWSSTFIMLSGVVLAERQCYWCGPLAEQVHRSRRAPPCDLPTNHVTTCEPGLAYCAVVATSPPYVESRLCVKLYQDECYPLFCNSTNTWKMTCPCRDDLCNGNNTERETEAFADLAKLVAKSQNNRIKKREISNFLTSSTRERTIIITNVTELNKTNEEMNEINDDDQMIVVTSRSWLEQSKRNVKVDNDNQINAEIKEDPSTENSGIENSSTDNPNSESDELNNSENPIDEATTQNDNKLTTSNKVTELDTAHLTIQNENKEIDIGEPSTTDSFNEITSQEMETTIITTVAKTNMKNNLINNNIKSSEQLPTAEALQQNVNPISSTKTTESMKTEATDSSTMEHEPTPETRTVEPTEGKNIAMRPSLTQTFVPILFFICFEAPVV